MRELESFDAVVIGAGSGLDIASAFTSSGGDVAVVEPGPMGGTCLNRGCIPSKMLIKRAELANRIRESERFGIDAEMESFRFSEIVDEVNSTVTEEAEAIEQALEQSDRHTLYRTEAEFVDSRTVELDGERITGDRIFIAAGTRPLVPPVDGLEDVSFMTSKEALELEERPDELVVIGGGYIACEMANFYRAAGTRVKILEMADRLLGHEDEEVSRKFTSLAEEKYRVATGVKATEVREEDGRKVVGAESKDGGTEEFAGDELLVAAGRRPNTDRLGLEDTDIELDENGFVETDGRLETSVEGVYAIGDIAGNYLFKHSANYEAEIAARASLGEDVEADYTAMPHAVFSDPQISGVGKTEGELQEEGVEYEKSVYSYGDTGMGLALKEEDGFVKLLASPDGEILGFHAIGPEASSIIHEVLVAKRNGLGVEGIADTVHIHPALNEVVGRAFDSV